MRSLSILVLLLVQSLAFCQEKENGEATSFRIPFACSPGQTHTYDVTQTKYKDGKISSARTQQLILKILSVDDEKIVATMKLVAKVDEATLKKLESDPITKAIKEQWDSLVFEVVMTRNGVFSEFQNIEEIEAAMAKARDLIGKIVNDMKPALLKMGKDPAELDRIFATVMKHQGSTQVATQRILTPLNLILEFVDTEHEIGKPKIDRTEVDLGPASALPSTETYRVVEMKPESNLAVVQFQRLIEGQEAATKFHQAIEAMVQEMKPDHKPRTSFPKVTVLSDSLMEGRMDLNSGWPRAVSWVVKMNNLKNDQLQVTQQVEVQRVESNKQK